jgi:beta-galactosidase
MKEGTLRGRLFMKYPLTRRDFVSAAALVGGGATIGAHRLWANEVHGAPEGPPSAMPRRTSFDQGWKFIKGDFLGAVAEQFEDREWTALDLPHDWSIAGPYSESEPSGRTGGYLPAGIGWYRKSFHLPHNLSGKRILLQFDGIYQCSDVWINGHHLGSRPYGFSTFHYDLRPHLHFGDGPNVVAVRVDNSHQPNLRWYSGSGIYRHTWLIQTGEIHIAPWGTVVRTAEVTASQASIDVSTRVMNEGDISATATLRTELRDQAGNVVQTFETVAEVPAGGEFVIDQTLKVLPPDLWSIATPHMYSAQQTVLVQHETVDAMTTPFGIRTIRFDVDRGFFLNEEHVKMNGVCLHEDGGAVGSAIPERVWERRFQLLKEMGCNAIRCSHNPPAEEFLNLCDRMGILVMDEAFDEWREAKGQTPKYAYHRYFDEWAPRDLADMIARDRNHPCIVLWSAGNEVPDQDVPRGVETLRALIGIIRAGDPTRPITVACDQIAAEPASVLPAFLDELDIVGYNYADRWRDRREKVYSIDRAHYPRRRFVGSESPTPRGVRGKYEIDLNKDSPHQLLASNILLEVEQLQKFVQTYDYVIGDFLWTGIDYLGESAWPFKSSNAGALDTCGFPKDSYFFYKSIWTKTPVLHLFPHWNWKGSEGRIIPVYCFTNCDTVELFMNGKSFGVKGYEFPRVGMEGEYDKYPARARALQTSADLHLSWDVPYEPGTLKAVGIKDGKVIEAVEVSTSGEPAAVRLSADRTRIDTVWDDLSHVTVEIVDVQGRVVPDAENDVVFEVRGPGLIAGLDNGNPASHESYRGDRRKAFSGMALVLVRSNGQLGEIELTASAKSLRADTVRITSASLSTGERLP